MTQQVNNIRALKKHNEDAVKKTDLFQLDPRTIVEEPGFNVRDTFDPDYWNRPETIAHVRGFAESYKAGRHVPPMVVRVKNGIPLLRAGAHRLRGLMLAIEEGAKIDFVPVFESKGDEIDETILIAKENGGQSLSALSLAVIYGRLDGWGWDKARIGSEFGKTGEHVRQTLKLLELPVAMKKLIADGTVSASYAVELYEEHGDKAVEMVQSVAEQKKTEAANAPAGSKPKKVVVTKSSIEQGPRLTKKLVGQMHTQFVSLTSKLDQVKPEQDGSVTLKLDQAELKTLLELKAILDGKKSDEPAEEQLDLLSEVE